VKRKKKAEDVHSSVRESYARIADEGTANGCCRPPEPCCQPRLSAAAKSEDVGYSAEELQAVPEDANLGVGCGNPTAIASLRQGEVVLDLGCGAGIDCFLAAVAVGPTGRVIGVDMTPEMLSRARANAKTAGCDNVEFRLGEIEHLPVADASVDVVVSNCVINLTPDKQAVYAEAFRALKPGGRLAISDVVATAQLPRELREDETLWCGCIAGAETPERVEGILAECGFVDIDVQTREESRSFIKDWAPGTGSEAYVMSAYIRAVKPKH
jgi:SAM-dependent methyltransferase